MRAPGDARGRRRRRRGGHRQPDRRSALMRVAIAGAGAVGRSVAAELLENGHEVLLIDKDPRAIKADSVPNAEWLLADACELSSLDEAALQRCDVVIASTGDDKANLVISLLAKTEFAVPRTVGRVNHPRTSGCSTSRGASTSRCRRRASCRRWSRRPSASATWSGCARSGRATPTWSSSPCPTTRRTSARLIRDVPWPGDTTLAGAAARGPRPPARPRRDPRGPRRAAVRRQRGRRGRPRAAARRPNAHHADGASE